MPQMLIGFLVLISLTTSFVLGQWSAQRGEYDDMPTITAIGVYDRDAAVPPHILRSVGDECNLRFGTRVVALRLKHDWMLTVVDPGSIITIGGQDCIITGHLGTLYLDTGESDDYGITVK